MIKTIEVVRRIEISHQATIPWPVSLLALRAPPGDEPVSDHLRSALHRLQVLGSTPLAGWFKNANRP